MPLFSPLIGRVSVVGSSSSGKISIMTEITCSIVVPVYNSEQSLIELHQRISNVLINENVTYEIIFIDDYSHDNSWEVLKKIKMQDDNCVIIRLIRNFGQHNALLCGMKKAKGKYIICLDDDLQHPPEEIPKFLSAVDEKTQVIYGKYSEKRHSRLENSLSSIFQYFIHRILNMPKSIYFSSFVLYDRSFMKYISSLQISRVFLPALVAQVVPPMRIKNITVLHEPRKFGRSNYSLSKYFKYSLTLLINHSSLPLRLVSVIGILISFVSFLFGFIIFIRHFLDPSYGLMGWTSLIVALTFFNGMVLFSLGILGEYMHRMLSEMTYTQPYIIERIID